MGLDEIRETRYRSIDSRYGWDVDDYWNPWDRDDWDWEWYWDWKGDFLNRVRNLIQSAPFNPIIRAEIVWQSADDIRTHQPAGVEKTESRPPYSADELPGALANHIDGITRESDVSLRERLQVDSVDLAYLRMINSYLLGTSERSFSIPNGVLVMALLFAPFWIRPISTWTGPLTFVDDTIDSLVDHLFVRYPVPSFLYLNWNTGRELPNLKWTYWFILIGNGSSLHRAARDFYKNANPWKISKRLTHYLFQAPRGLTALEVCMWAEVMRLTGSEEVFDRLLRHTGYVLDPTDISREDDSFLSFWYDTVRWLGRYDNDLTDEMCEVLLEWAIHMFVQRNVSFSWRGRKPRNAYDEAMKYRVSGIAWKEHGWNWRYQDENGNQWTVDELNSETMLQEEGDSLHHCVGSYVIHCYENRCSIFSLKVNGERRLTVEVNPLTRRIGQARGSFNRSTTDDEYRVLSLWQNEIMRSGADLII